MVKTGSSRVISGHPVPGEAGLSVHKEALNLGSFGKLTPDRQSVPTPSETQVSTGHFWVLA
jgi:hypothetical protein